MSRINKEKIIKNIYLDILNREPDEEGLEYYFNSGKSYDEICYDLKNSEEYFQLATTNRIPIVMPTYNRPDYLIQVLNALKNCEYKDEFYILTSEEPNEEVSKVFDSVDFMYIIRNKNKEKLGCNLNILTSIDRAMSLSDKFLIIEDDIVPAKDALALYKWFLKEHNSLLLLHNIEYNPEQFNKLEKLNHFIPWGWGTTKDVWVKIRKYVAMSVGPSSDGRSWDSHLCEQLHNDYNNNPDITLLRPLVSRVQNIGEVGTYVPNPEWQRENQRCKYWAGDFDLMVTDYEFV